MTKCNSNMIEEFETLCKDTGGYLEPDHNKEQASFIRRLLCRFIDVSETFPGFYKNIGESMYLLSKVCDVDGEGFRRWDIEVKYEESGEKICKVTCPRCDTYGDYDGSTIKITVHAEILSDNWKSFLEELIRRKRVDGIKKQIAEIENMISNGPSKIEMLKKELEKWESQSNFGNVS